MSVDQCIAPFGGSWIGKTDKELRDEVNRKLDLVRGMDFNLISNRSQAISLLLSFVDAHAKEFEDFVNAI
jgi:hypothetical protein